MPLKLDWKQTAEGWQAELEDEHIYPDDEDPRQVESFEIVLTLVGEKLWEYSISHSARDQDGEETFEGMDEAEAKAMAESLAEHFLDRWSEHNEQFWRDYEAEEEEDD